MSYPVGRPLAAQRHGKRMPRHVTAASLVLIVTACTGSDGGTSGNEVSAASPPASTCTAATAVMSRQVLISERGFDPACVSVAIGTQFFLINDSDASQSLQTAPGAPDAFQVDLPKKTSTYVRTFEKQGSYVIEQAGGTAPLTLIVR